MSIVTEDDIMKYRTAFECYEHWELKRTFMMEHKDKFPEERLICLAQVFVNIEVLGCKYPAEVMKQVAALGEDVAKHYRNSRKNSLKRTFAAASDAARKKVCKN